MSCHDRGWCTVKYDSLSGFRGLLSKFNFSLDCRNVDIYTYTVHAIYLRKGALSK